VAHCEWAISPSQHTYSSESIGSGELWRWALKYSGNRAGWVLKALADLLHWRKFVRVESKEDKDDTQQEDNSQRGRKRKKGKRKQKETKRSERKVIKEMKESKEEKKEEEKEQLDGTARYCPYHAHIMDSIGHMVTCCGARDNPINSRHEKRREVTTHLINYMDGCCKSDAYRKKYVQYWKQCTFWCLHGTKSARQYV